MGRRASLSPEAIVETALAMIDREGERGFSMRKLAGEMGVDPMTIYHYHENRDALVHEVLHALMRDFEVPAPGADWREDIRELCQALRRLARRHPGAFQIYELYERWIPGELAMHEAFLAVLSRAGFDPAAALRGMRILLTYAEAFAVDEIAGWLDPMDEADRREFSENLSQDEHPCLSAALETIETVDPDADFDFGLDVLIRGLEAKLR